VKSHVKHIFLKLAVSTRAQAVYQAGSLGLLRGGDPRQEEGAVAVSRSNFLPVAAILSSAIVEIGHAGPASADPLSVGAGSPATVQSPSPERTLTAQASGEDTLARCQQLFGLYKNLDDDIASLVSKGLDPRVQKTLDVVRVIGNNSVHPAKSTFVTIAQLRKSCLVWLT